MGARTVTRKWEWWAKGEVWFLWKPPQLIYRPGHPPPSLLSLTFPRNKEVVLWSEQSLATSDQASESQGQGGSVNPCPEIGTGQGLSLVSVGLSGLSYN